MNKYSLKNIRSIAAAGIVTVASAMPGVAIAQSTNLVDWQGSYIGDRAAVTSTRESSATNYNDGEVKGKLYPLNNTTVISPYVQNYGGTSAAFYGAAQQLTGNLDATGSPQLRVVADAAWNGRNRILVQSQGTTSGSLPAEVKGFFYWKKEDFLSNPSGSEPLSLSDIGSFYVNAPNVRATSASVRFVVQSEGTWYLSEAKLTGATGGGGGNLGSLTLDNLSTSQWGEWVVQDSSSSLINGAPLSFDVSGGTLNNITAVGFYYEANYIYANSAMVSFDQFTVAPAIPEPSSVALISGVAILSLVLCKRLRK